MKRFFKTNKKAILKHTLILAAAILAFVLAHKIGTSERGYEAVGGEIFVPFLIVFAKKIWEIIKEPFKAVKSEHGC